MILFLVKKLDMHSEVKLLGLLTNKIHVVFSDNNGKSTETWIIGYIFPNNLKTFHLKFIVIFEFCFI